MTKNQATYSLPQEILWGTATAGYQVEGQSTLTDFWQWEQGAGHIAQGQKSGRAYDWWEGQRWQEDFDLAATDGHTAHRLSVEWSRVEPVAGRWDEDALDHYRQMVKGLRARVLEPMVSLHYFVSPLWVAERNAWETGEVIRLFEQYVRKVVGAPHQDVKPWCTISEPNGYVYSGWVASNYPAGKKNVGLALRVAQTLLKAHAVAYHTIHSLQSGARAGLAILIM